MPRRLARPSRVRHSHYNIGAPPCRSHRLTACNSMSSVVCLVSSDVQDARSWCGCHVPDIASRRPSGCYEVRSRPKFLVAESYMHSSYTPIMYDRNCGPEARIGSFVVLSLRPPFAHFEFELTRAETTQYITLQCVRVLKCCSPCPVPVCNEENYASGATWRPRLHKFANFCPWEMQSRSSQPLVLSCAHTHR